MPFGNVPFEYPIIMVVALGAGALLLRRYQGGLGLKAEQRIAIGVAAFCGAMLGAKLPFALSDLDGLRDGSVWFSNGKTIVCGIVGAYFAVELAKWTLGIRTKTGDTFVVPVAVTVAIGRLACLSAGCCYGTPTSLPWGIACGPDALVRHPTQLYETLFHLTMALLAHHMIQRGIWRGQLAKFYIIAYLAYRFATEFVRPEARLSLGLTGYQWFALCFIPVFGTLWWYDRRTLKSESCESVERQVSSEDTELTHS